LFNLKDNPDELLIEHHDSMIVKLTGNHPEPFQKNLADDPGYADKLMEMELLLLDKQFEFNDPFLMWNQKDLLIKMNLTLNMRK